MICGLSLILDLLICLRKFQNNGHMWWGAIHRVFRDDTEGELRRTQLRDEHVRLTPSSRMSVRLAAQVNFLNHSEPERCGIIVATDHCSRFQFNILICY